MSEHYPLTRVYRGGTQPDVEVLVDGHWHPGELRMWSKATPDAPWVAQVQWRPAGTTTRRIDDFPEDQVRPDDTDHSRGRTT